jgi:predicted transcriptional regulator
MLTNRRAVLVLAASALTLAAIPGAYAAPKEGEAAADARAEDVEGRVVETRSFRGKKTLIFFYEGKDTQQQNTRLKLDIAKLTKTDRYRSATHFAAVGDVGDYNYWPVKGIVKDKIREESKKSGWPIYCDWDGSFRSAYKLRRDVSNVVVVGKNGSVLFAAEGTVDARKRERLFSVLRAEVEGGA